MVTEHHMKSIFQRGCTWFDIRPSSVQKELPDGRFSLEQDFMEKMVRKIQMYAFISQGYFVDISISEDYEKAKFDFGDNSVKIF